MGGINNNFNYRRNTDQFYNDKRVLSDDGMQRNSHGRGSRGSRGRQGLGFFSMSEISHHDDRFSRPSSVGLNDTGESLAKPKRRVPSSGYFSNEPVDIDGFL